MADDPKDPKDPRDEEPGTEEGVEPSTWAARRDRKAPGPFGEDREKGFGPFREEDPPPARPRFLEDTDELGAVPPPPAKREGPPPPPPPPDSPRAPAPPPPPSPPDAESGSEPSAVEKDAAETDDDDEEADGKDADAEGADGEQPDAGEGGSETGEQTQDATLRIRPGAPANIDRGGPAEGGVEDGEQLAARAAAEELGTGDQTAPALGGVPPGMVPPPGYESVEVEGPREPRLWARFLAGSAIVVCSMAIATAASILAFLSDIAEGIQPLPADAIRSLDDIESGEPRTILMVGSDQRISDREMGIPARADTAMLVRLDGSRGAIATLRFPRDLKVRIPGHGTDKLNAAYAVGGPGKTLDTIKELTGLEVHHLIDVNFNGFQRAVNALGCIYVDVDRRYFNSNEGRPVGQQYAEIDLMPGYQRLCGSDSLDFARYRHEDNDLVRGARQQEVLRQARARISAQQVFQSQDQLINIFKRFTRSDLKGQPGQVLDLLNLFLDARKQPVKEVNLDVKLGSAYVTTGEKAMAKARREFLGLTGTDRPRSQSAERELELQPDTEEARRRQLQRRRERRAEQRSQSRPSLIDVSGAGEAQAREAAGGVNFDVFYPTRIESSSQYTDQTHSYRILAPNGEQHRAYKLVLRRQRAGGIEYYGVMGTEWRDPPLLRSPGRTRKVGDRNYLVYDGNGSRPRVVAWRTERAAYWISNTLLQSLSEAEMLAIADSSRRIPF